MAKSKPEKVIPFSTGPQLIDMPLGQILEPELPARIQMDDQKMRDMIDSLKMIGMAIPIIAERKDGMVEIIDGHRRFLAARELKWERVPVVVYPEGHPQVLAMRLHANIIREALNPADEAVFMAEVREKYQLDEEGLMRFFHCSGEYLGTRFSLLRGDKLVFFALQSGEIRLGAASQLNRISDEGTRRYYLDIARKGDHPERVVRQWVQDWIAQQRPSLPLVDADQVRQQAADAVSKYNEEHFGADPQSAAAGEGQAHGGIECALCGGSKDPWNLITVMMHKWHWDEILRAVEKAGKA
jgi:ParB/RepB/Spo0J family partition protein